MAFHFFMNLLVHHFAIALTDIDWHVPFFTVYKTHRALFEIVLSQSPKRNYTFQKTVKVWSRFLQQDAFIVKLNLHWSQVKTQVTSLTTPFYHFPNKWTQLSWPINARCHKRLYPKSCNASFSWASICFVFTLHLKRPTAVRKVPENDAEVLMGEQL